MDSLTIRNGILIVPLTAVLIAGIFTLHTISAGQGSSSPEIPAIDQIKYEEVETATFALGCFWGPDALFGATPGVIRTRVGYAGGVIDNPTYENLGDHTETIQLDYNPNEISYGQLLNIFWSNHNPVGRLFSRQYRPVVFYHNDQQRELAEESKERIGKQHERKIVTVITKLDKFHVAEDYHQKYRLRNTQYYLERYKSIYPDPENFRDSTATARVNGYLAGYGTLNQLKAELDSLSLTPEQQQRLLNTYQR